MFISGMISGLGGLYRFDLFLLLITFFSIIIFLDVLLRRGMQVAVAEVLFLYAGATLPIALWMGVLFSQGGAEGINAYFASLHIGASGHARYWSTPLPKLLNTANPFSKYAIINSFHAFSLIMLALSYMVGGVIGLYR